MKLIYLIESLKNIKKNIMTSMLLILCFIILFCLFGEVSIQSFLAGYAKTDSELSSKIEYTKIALAVTTVTPPSRQMAALSELSEDEIVQAGYAMDKIICGLREDYNAFETKMIHYGSGLHNNTEKIYYCSYDLYEISSSMLIIKEGKWFDIDYFDSSFQDQKENIIPVLIGPKFSEKYDLSVGDVFAPNMFIEEEKITNQWKVIGIFEPDSSFISRGGIQPVNNSVLIPDYTVPTLEEFIEMSCGQITEGVLFFIVGDLFTHFRTTDFYIKKDDMVEAIKFVNEHILSNSFLSQYYIAKESSDTLTMVAQNQEKASNFYNTIAIITYILSSFGIIMSVSNKIQNNKRNYAIHSLNGATVYDLIMCSITEIMLLMLIADAFFFAFPYRMYYNRVTMGNGIYIGRETPIFVFAVNIITLLVAVFVSIIVLHKFDTVEHLKKKE